MCLAVMLMFSISANYSYAKTYECISKNMATFTSKGLVLEKPSDWLRDAGRFTFDTDTGIMKHPEARSGIQFDIISRDEDGFIDPMRDVVAVHDGGRELIRIRIWENDIPFFFDSGGEYYGGSCEMVK